MKTSFSSNSDCIHNFAQRTQSKGHSYSVFFENTNKIYSYGHHYLLGEFIENKSGEIAIIINSQIYSNSTSKHSSILRSATSQYRQFFTNVTNIDLLLKELEKLTNKLLKARKQGIYINEANILYRQYINYCNFMQIEQDIRILETMKVFQGIDLTEYKAKEKARQAKKLNSNLEKFNNYEISTFADEVNNFAYLRISANNEKIQTSKGVNISFRGGLLLYKLILAKKDIRLYDLEGYKVISINGTLKVGCHTIPISEVHRIGEQLLKLEQN